MVGIKIENLEGLLRQFIAKNQTVIGSEVTRLTQPGENYMSLMLRVIVHLRNIDTNAETVLDMVAKCMDRESIMMKDYISDIFFKELKFYTEVVPTLKEFLKTNGKGDDACDIFPQFYAARSNIKGVSDEMDEHALILMENLKTSGFKNIDRHLGFDLEGAKLILKDIATFHGVPIALKIKNPTLHEEKIKNNCKTIKMPSETDHPPPSVDVIFDILADYTECQPYIPKIKSLGNMMSSMQKWMNSLPSEPFATMVHADLWINNTMQTFKDGHIVKNKFVDFQVTFYKSPADDLIFFLLTSVQLSVLKENLDNLIKFYHDNLLCVLKDLECDTSCFGIEAFMKEIESSGEINMMRCFMMIPYIIYGEKNVAPDLSKPPGMGKKKEDVHPDAKEKLAYIVSEFGKRGWI